MDAAVETMEFYYSLPASLSKGPKKLDSFHTHYTKGLKVSYERVRLQESKYGGCVDGRHQIRFYILKLHSNSYFIRSCDFWSCDLRTS